MWLSQSQHGWRWDTVWLWQLQEGWDRLTMSTLYKCVTKQKPPERLREHTVRAQVGSSGELVLLHLLMRHYRGVQSFYFYSKDHVNWDTEIKIGCFLSWVFALISICLSCDSSQAHAANISLKIKIFFSLVQKISPFSVLFYSLLLFVLGRIQRILLSSRLFITGDSLEMFFPDILQA